MGWQPGEDDDQDAERSPGFASPGGSAPAPERDPRLAGFAKGAEWDTCPPSVSLAAVLEGASGPEWRCAGATTDEMIGMLRQAQALESQAAAVKLGIVRSLIRDDDEPLPGGGYHGDLPEGWTKSLTHQVALALSMPVVSADKLMWVAWDLQARLPGIGQLLASGALTYAKAKSVHEAFLLLSDEHAAKAEALILPELPGKTFNQVKRLAEQAAITVDPEAAARRREDAERNRCRVELFREDSGAAALAGRDLPADEALAAHAHVCARARQYKESSAFPGGTGMDQFRAAAYLDLLNGIAAETRIASGRLAPVARTADSKAPDDDASDCDGPGDDEPGGGGSPRSPGSRGPSGGDGAANTTPPRLADLVLPLVTLLGRAERPGEGHALGPLDPDLCRNLAIAAVGSPWTRLCVTVTDSEGIAIGHGCAKAPRNTKTRGSDQSNLSYRSNRAVDAGLALPSAVNLTITAAHLEELGAVRPRGPGEPPGAGEPPGPGESPGPYGEPKPPSRSWNFTKTGVPGPLGGQGTWILSLPDGRQFPVALEPVPTYECDHRHQSHAYQPNDRLRHLVQVRDYTCTFPMCSRHAKASDFEHAVPYDQGGATCACNAGARSRACHQVKQSKGWKVTQPKPGWHRWQTPSGRVYVQGPKHYPT